MPLIVPPPALWVPYIPPPTFDSVVGSGVVAAGAGSTGATWTHNTNSADVNCVILWLFKSNTATFSSYTLNGTSPNHQIDLWTYSGSFAIVGQCWLGNFTPGALAMAFNVTSASGAYIGGCSTAYKYVGGITASGSYRNNGTSGSASLTIPSVPTRDLAVQMFMSSNGTNIPFTGYNQTERYNSGGLPQDSGEATALGSGANIIFSASTAATTSPWAAIGAILHHQ